MANKKIQKEGKTDQVVGFGGGLVLVDQVLDDVTRLVHLVETVAEHGLLAELVEEGAALVQLVELVQRPLEQLRSSHRQKKKLIRQPIEAIACFVSNKTRC